MPYPFSNPQVTIANGTALSGAFYIGAGDLIAIGIPAAWTAANLTFQVSADGVNFQDLYDNAGNEVVVTGVAGKEVTVTGGSAPWAKIRSGTNGAPVNQAADRVLSCLVRKRPILST